MDAGVTGVGLWREEVREFGVANAAALMRDAGLAVTSLCRGGFFQQDGWRDENKRAIDEAAALGAPVLVLVSGGLPTGSRDIDAARAHVGEAVGELVPHALAAGVRLAIEPLHPMYASDRCVVSTLDQALDLAAPYPAEAVGVVVDTYHLWWDDRVWAQIARAGREDRIACFQVADWLTPLPAGVLLGRGCPGPGAWNCAGSARRWTRPGTPGRSRSRSSTREVWARPGREVLDEALDGYQLHVL